MEGKENFLARNWQSFMHEWIGEGFWKPIGVSCQYIQHIRSYLCHNILLSKIWE